MNTNDKFQIRPSARLIRAIGQDLIKDVYAAIVELVKNSYDADSPKVCVSFEYNKKSERLLVRVEDYGHGMDVDTVVNKWLVPATDDKLLRKTSGRGRVLQGRKGIGRFAASVLGERILLETTMNGKTTSLIIDMDELDDVQYLDEFDVEVATSNTSNTNGTVIDIERDNVSEEEVKALWNSKQIHKLFVELRSLISPEDVYKAASDAGYDIYYDAFEIELVFKDFPIPEYTNRTIKVTPFPVLDLFDYRVSGKVDKEGSVEFVYENNNIPSLPHEKIYQKLLLDRKETMAYPGEIYIDIRVYDRDPESIDNIIKRGLKDPDTGEYVGKREARNILDEYYGVGVYREQFRIRPYGEQSFDWLELDKFRVQDPSKKIGHNQVIGFIYIRPEEESGLTEKSARDGLTENGNYYGLKFIAGRFINELETRRHRHREQTMKGGRNRAIDDDISEIFDFDDVAKKISKDLDAIGFREKDRNSVNKVVEGVLEAEKKNKSKVVRKIKDTIAIYQGQATLGKITHVLLHEGRKNIKFISETIPRVIKWAKKLSLSPDEELQDKLNDRADKLHTHANGLSYLFKKIEPLARTRRSPSKEHNICDLIESSFDIFKSELVDEEISYTVHSGEECPAVYANEIDLYTVFSNLIENSIYWMSMVDAKRTIQIEIYQENDHICVDYTDNGPGFQGGNLEYLFEPGYSMKPKGTGLGLALAGEAMARTGGKIEAKNSDSGAFFEILFKGN